MPKTPQRMPVSCSGCLVNAILHGILPPWLSCEWTTEHAWVPLGLVQAMLSSAGYVVSPKGNGVGSMGITSIFTEQRVKGEQQMRNKAANQKSDTTKEG